MAASMEKIETIGKRWVHPKTGEVRWYVNDCWRFAGLELEYYNTGNICYSELNGEEISHSEARRLISGIDKCWVTEDGAVHIHMYGTGYKGFDAKIIAGIKAAIEEDVLEVEEESESITAVEEGAKIVAIHQTKTGSIIAVQREISEGSVTEEPAPMDIPDEVRIMPADMMEAIDSGEEVEMQEGVLYIGLEDTIDKAALRTLIESSDITGGITDPENGDEIQMRDFDGTPYSVILSVSLGDRQPSDDELVECARQIYAGWTVDVEGWQEPTLYAVRWTDREDDDREERYLSMDDAKRRAQQVGRHHRAAYGRLWNDGDLTDGGEVEPPVQEILEEAEAVVCVSQSGTALSLNLTRPLKSIGAKRGDYVKVIIRKA